MNLVETSRRLISIDSTPLIGNMAVVEFLSDEAKSLGFEVEVQSENLNGLQQGNIILRPPGFTAEQDELLLQAHLDTEDPGSYGLWSKTQENPFNASIYENLIFGLGTARTKLDFLCKMKAAAPYLQQKLARPFVIVGTYGSAQGMAGAVKLIRRKMIHAKKALVGAPTELSLCISGPGSLTVEGSVPFTNQEKLYRKGHDLAESSSTQSKMFFSQPKEAKSPQKIKDSAIGKMLEYLTQLPEGIAVMDLDGGVSAFTDPASAALEFDIIGSLNETVVPKLATIVNSLKGVESELESYPDEGFTPKVSTINLGMVRTHQDHVRITGSCRLVPAVPEEAYLNLMESVKKSCDDVGAVFRVKDYKAAHSIDANSDFLQSCQQGLQEMSLSSELKKSDLSSEACVFHRLGIECIVFGPGKATGNANAANEHVELEDLDRAIGFYSRVIGKVCL